MTGSCRSLFRRIAAALPAAVLLLPTSLYSAPGDEPPAPPSLPFYLKGVDLNLPAQAAFKGWPSKELRDRPYWLTWSTLSLQRAVVFNQPIFLLVTVPWNRAAQRMAQEVLADSQVLSALNPDYVALLVSADRRPDLYARYGTGNWPAISLLLPNGAPMLSQVNPQKVALPITLGPTDVKGVLFNLQEGRKYFDLWQNVLQGVSQVYEKRVDLEEAKPGAVDEKSSDPVARWLLGNLDAKNGGFGVAPKYALPGVMEWAFLREDGGRPGLVDAARRTLTKMAASPLHDEKDGGFHRMAAAPDWGGIQYEKLLDGNADLMRDMVFALREEDDPALRAALADTARFVTTKLARPSGGFFLGQMADPTSLDGGGYWTSAERDAAKAPPVDKLVLAGSNAMVGAALLRAGAILSDAALTKAGRDALDLVLQRAVVTGRGAGHVIESQPVVERFLVTQTEVAFGLLDGYESTGDARYLAAAKDVAEFVRNNMKVAGETAYRDHLPVGREFGLLDMPLRPMIDNARLARVLIRLEAQGALDGGGAAAKEILGSYTGDLASHGVKAVAPALALDELATEPLVVTIQGKQDDAKTQGLRQAALNIRRGWVVIRTGDKASSPAATLALKGTTRKINDPAALAGELKVLSDEAIGKP